MAANAHCFSAFDLKYIHDLRVVRALEAQIRADRRGHRDQLADRLRRILFSSSGQSNRLWALHRLSIEGHSGVRHAGGVRRLRILLFGRTDSLELRGLISVYLGRGGVCLLGTTLVARGARTRA